MKGGEMAHTMADLTALLQYLVKHNEEHADEIVELAGRARELGRDDAYGQLARGVELLRDANTSLRAALVTLEGQGVSR
jgi:hypothetical protein